MKQSLKPNSIIFPQPVLVIGSYDEKGEPDAMVAAWGGIYDTNQISFMLDHHHKTTENIKLSGTFTVSMATVPTMAQSDFFGTITGNQEPKKIELAGMHVVKSEHVNAPVLTEYPLTFECKVAKVTQVGEDFHFVGDIVNILADDSILTNGKVDVDKLLPLTFNAVAGTYVKLGETVGHAWREGRKVMEEAKKAEALK